VGPAAREAPRSAGRWLVWDTRALPRLPSSTRPSSRSRPPGPRKARLFVSARRHPSQARPGQSSPGDARNGQSRCAAGGATLGFPVGSPRSTGDDGSREQHVGQERAASGDWERHVRAFSSATGSFMTSGSWAVATGSQAAACPLRCPDCRDRPRQTVADPWQAKPRSLRALVGAKAAGGICLWGPFHPFPPPNHSPTRPAHPPFRPHAAAPLDSISLCWISLVTMPGRAGVGPPWPDARLGRRAAKLFFASFLGGFLSSLKPRLTHQVLFAWARRQRPTIASWCRSRLLLLDACSSVLLSLQLPWALSVTQYSILRTPCRCHHGHSVVVCRLICPLAAEPSQCRPGHEGARRRQPPGSAAWPNATRRDRLPPSLAGHHCTRKLRPLKAQKTMLRAHCACAISTCDPPVQLLLLLQ